MLLSSSPMFLPSSCTFDICLVSSYATDGEEMSLALQCQWILWGLAFFSHGGLSIFPTWEWLCSPPLG